MKAFASSGVWGPTAITATANYTVTAVNSGGSTTASLTITVLARRNLALVPITPAKLR